MTGRNRLATETSPYLRQHADNPVDWYPWGDEAFAAARERDVPILLSVGYSACHWCHVMAHESFEDAEVAAVMNAKFVNVKVDREERPDVDAVYMDAVQAITGRGGWPMTVFLAPDGRPFFGGTYFPRVQFLQLLEAVDQAWRNRRTDVLGQAEHLTQAINRTASLTPADHLPGREVIEGALAELAAAFDREWGGFGRAPKFPMTMNLELVLRAYQSGGHPEALELLTTTLDAMASGGIYDHLGGGFARYSVDDRWLIPHFEKMLSDQALLARLYLHAWQVTGETRWGQVATETVDAVLRDLRHPLGGFFSAEDADSADESGLLHEGRFATWTPAEIRAVLGDELAAAAMAWWGVTEEGNFEGRSVLHRPVRGDLLRPPHIEQARRLLFEARGRRPRPAIDDKVLTEWNALFLTTLAEAAAATGRADWHAAAVANGEFLVTHLRRNDGRWLRSWHADGGPGHLGFAADYAALVQAFIALHRLTGRARWIELAAETADTLLDLFWDPVDGGLFTVGEDAESLVVRPKDLIDNATPSANSLATNGLLQLAALTGEQRYANHAERILTLVGDQVGRHPTAFGHLLAAVQMHLAGIREIVVVGDRPDLVEAVHRRHLPTTVLAWGEPFGSPLWEGRRPGWAYVCEQGACQAPVDSVDRLLDQLREA